MVYSIFPDFILFYLKEYVILRDIIVSISKISMESVV